MTGFILAAGLGTRMKHITESTPKALVDVGGMTMLERTARRMVAAGVTRLVVNVHHHADQVMAALQGNFGLDVDIAISDETDLLRDTGGAIKHAAHLLRDTHPFLIHNVDILTDCNLQDMVVAHEASDAITTLAVLRRDNTRYLIVDAANNVCGHGNSTLGNETIARPLVGETSRVGFCGIHVVSQELLNKIDEVGAFSIITLYMRLIGEGYTISAHDCDNSMWMDIGSPEKLETARRVVGELDG